MEILVEGGAEVVAAGEKEGVVPEGHQGEEGPMLETILTPKTHSGRQRGFTLKRVTALSPKEGVVEAHLS
jgi:hypothetical protein